VIAQFLKFVFGTANQRKLKQLYPIVDLINNFEPSMVALSNEELQAKTHYFKEQLARGKALEDILPEAFAVVRESSRRFLNQRHYDVQLMGGIVLSQGKIAEMKTGEGKTLTATLALYLNALTGKGVHLITANDYLARRDSEWMAPVYNNLGMTVAALQNDMYDFSKKKAYQADILHGTSSEFGFDYLRDNMKFNLSDYVQRELYYGLVDEVDSVLIDEARTPLIISGQSQDENIDLVNSANNIISTMVRYQEKELQRYTATLSISDPIEYKKHLHEYIENNLYYAVDVKERNVHLTEKGVDFVEEKLGIVGLYAVENIRPLHYITQALKAYIVFKKDVDYLVYQDEVMIIDENTGRILAGRRYSDGLHQALEAKEGVTLQPETQTLASITIQNYFKLYSKLAGMTGTALTEVEEFHKIYNLDVISIPSNKTLLRKDMPDYIFLTERAKFKKIVDDIKERHKKGQPILIGTIAVETSEKLSAVLNREGIPHDVLNAKQHEREADIIGDAGIAGKITIATNMAGRGTDIKLTEEAKNAGGLYILGTERHESRRIDNQLRGRSGRQGDPGESRFYISLEDTLIRRFGRDSMQKAMIWSGMKEDDIIEDDMISDQIEVAQEKIEKDNFEARKYLIDYDSVLNQQRIIVYGLRREVITGQEVLFNLVKQFFKNYIIDLYQGALQNQEQKMSAEYIFSMIYDKLHSVMHFDTILKEDFVNMCKVDETFDRVVEYLHAWYLARLFKDCDAETIEGQEKIHARSEMQKWVILEILDYHWRQHIVNLDQIKEGISLRSWGQKTPLLEYKREAFLLFQRMLHNLMEEVISKITQTEVMFVDIDKIINKRRHEMEEIENLVMANTQENDKSANKKKLNSVKKTKTKK
jgi:preprotein translocase subunit SecA